jgi:hypothetical protein
MRVLCKDRIFALCARMFYADGGLCPLLPEILTLPGDLEKKTETLQGVTSFHILRDLIRRTCWN